MLRILPHELIPPPGAAQARARIWAAGEAYQAAHAPPVPPCVVAPVPVIVEPIKVPPSVQLAANLAKSLDALPRPSKRKARTPAARALQILAEVAEKYDLDPVQICCATRKAPFSIARHEACYRITAGVPTLSYTEIGAVLGIKHVTVIQGLRHYGKAHGLPVNFGKRVKGRRIGVYTRT